MARSFPQRTDSGVPVIDGRNPGCLSRVTTATAKPGPKLGLGKAFEMEIHEESQR